MPTRPRLFLLDADVVIELHKMGVWNQLAARVQILLPGTVARRETQYWIPEKGLLRTIDLSAQIQSGAVQVVESTASEMTQTRGLFDESMKEAIHAGELEALTVLRLWGEGCPEFSTADRKACEALCLLDLGHLAVSLEELLRRAGLSRQVKRQFSEERLQQILGDAGIARAQGRGLALEE
jgi:hypothetical protein